MDSVEKRKIIKKFVVSISRPLSLEENLKLIEDILRDIKGFKLDETDYIYLWKGILYSIWYTEMGKGCEQIVTKLYELADAKLVINGLDNLNKEWFSIDYIRLDKFMFLSRRLTHRLISLQFKQFIKFKTRSTDSKVIKNPNLLKNVLNKMKSVGLIDHFLDIFFAELFKILSPFLVKKKNNKLITEFLNLINKTLVDRLSSNTDQRTLSIWRLETANLFKHLGRNKLVLKDTIGNLVKLCKQSSSRKIRSVGSGLENKLEEF